MYEPNTSLFDNLPLDAYRNYLIQAFPISLEDEEISDSEVIIDSEISTLSETKDEKDRSKLEQNKEEQVKVTLKCRS